MGQDFLGTTGDGKNFYGYVANDALNNTDPNGLYLVKAFTLTPTSKGRINPTLKDKQAGMSFRWTWNQYGLAHIAQKVQVNGTFRVETQCDRNSQNVAPPGFQTDARQHHEIHWTEEFIEIWGVKSPTRADTHQAKPRKPAEYLESQLGKRKFVEVNANPDWLKLGNERVTKWEWEQYATFTVVNGFYPNVNSKHNYRGKNDFKITKRILNGKDVGPGVPNNFFMDALYPGPIVIDNLSFPPPRTFGETGTCSDHWRAEFNDGDLSVTNNFTTTKYLYR